MENSDQFPIYHGWQFNPTDEEEDHPKLLYDLPVSELAISPTALAYCPPYDLRTTCFEPSIKPVTFSFFSGEEWSDEHLGRVKAALEYYNQKNGTEYEELVHDVTLCNCFLSDGIWFHINFRAKQVVDGKDSHKGFFAEIRADVSTDSPLTQTLVVTACLILEGAYGTNHVCDFCPNVLHPDQGFLKRRYNDDPYRMCLPTYSPNYPRCPDPGVCYEEGSDEHLRRVNAALEYYNKKNDTNYEHVRLLNPSNCFISDGTWYHFNFKAKEAVDGKCTEMGFFAEIRADVSTENPTMQTLTVTACCTLEGCTRHGCDFCSDFLHPNQIFLERGDIVGCPMDPISCFTYI